MPINQPGRPSSQPSSSTFPHPEDVATSPAWDERSPRHVRCRKRVLKLLGKGIAYDLPKWMPRDDYREVVRARVRLLVRVTELLRATDQLEDLDEELVRLVYDAC